MKNVIRSCFWNVRKRSKKFDFFKTIRPWNYARLDDDCDNLMTFKKQWNLELINWKFNVVLKTVVMFEVIQKAFKTS